MKKKNIDITDSSAAPSEMIPGTDWTHFEAASMAKELNREARLFPKHRRPVPFLCSRPRTV